MRARLTKEEQARLRDVQAAMQQVEAALHVEGTREDVARAADRASEELERLALDIRLRDCGEAA